MRLCRLIASIDAHVAGEPMRVIVGGLPFIPGNTIVEKERYFSDHFDYIRRALMLEPRGHLNMVGALLTEPTRKNCGFGVIFFDNSGYLDMCVHGSVGIVKVLLETGMVQPKEKVTELKLDTSAGPVKATAHVESGIIGEIKIHNVPSFLSQSNIEINVPRVGFVAIDVAFGGNFFAIVEAKELRVEVEAQNLGKLAKLGLVIRDLINRRVKVDHPSNRHINRVNLVEICDRSKNPEATYRNVVIFGAGQADRSPCGTGMCARMAELHAKGLLAVGEDVVSESIIGTLFKGRIVSETRVGKYDAIIPEIGAQAYITGFHQFITEAGDPLEDGFIV